MNNKIFILTVIILLPTIANAQDLWKQRRWEASAGIGTTHIFGDIGGFSTGENALGFKDFGFKQTGFHFNTNIKYRIIERVSVRINLGIGTFHSSDEKGSNVERGYESNTFFIEPTIMGEYYFVKSKAENSFLMMNSGENYAFNFFSLLDVYAFSGIGGLSYSVTPNEELEPNLSAEKGFTAVIPIGVGVNFVYSGQFNFGLEFSGRYTFTDDLEGYTSEHSSANDMYYFVTLTFTYKMRTGENGWPAF